MVQHCIAQLHAKAVHLRDAIVEALPASRLKDETLSIRTSAEIKQLLRLAADRERRSVASMIEIWCWSTREFTN